MKETPISSGSTKLDWRTTVGLEAVFAGLSAVIDGGRMHPVVLLEGPDGVGKRHVAMFMAAKFLCHKKTACGTCGACREVLAGLHPDVLLMDQPEEKVLRTSELEELQRSLDVYSTEGLRIAIITDCDRMTREAANRMLKTLEEPPGHVRLILTTSRPRSLLPTVLGRCLRWRVTAPEEASVLVWLKEQLKRHERTLESDEFLRAWIRRAGGCPGVILRELEDSDDRGAAIVDRMRTLLWARVPSEVTRAAEELARNTKPSIAEILAACEWELNHAYRVQDQNSSSLQNIKTRTRRREAIHQLRQLAVRGKVHLNAQLAAESIGLAAFIEENGDQTWHM